MKNNQSFLTLTLFVATILIGVGLFVWQQNTNQKLVVDLLSKNQELQNQIRLMNQKIDTEEKLTDMTVISPFNTQSQSTTEPLIYPKDDTSYKTEIITSTVSKTFDAKTLQKNTVACNQTVSENEITNLLSKYSDQDVVTQYKFVDKTDPSAYFMTTVIPNKAGFNSIDQFKKYFDICSVGGELYPAQISDKNLMFVSSCGSGVKSDTSTKCTNIRNQVENQLQLK